MYAKSAEYYDLIYASVGKDYRGESAKLVDFLSTHAPHASTLLDVACGTGEHDRFLKSRFDVEGVDINDTFIAIARKKNPECRYHLGDMRSFSVGRKFDVVTCLFSAIGFQTSIDDLVATVARMRAHLNVGGVILIEPWFTRATWQPERWPVHMMTYEAPDVRLVRVNKSEVDGRFSIIRAHYIYADRSRLEHFEETGRLILFEREDFEKAFSENGLRMEYEESGLIGRGLYIAK